MYDEAHARLRQAGPLEPMTHRIGAWPENRTLATSEGRGWRHVHAALITVKSWSGILQPTGHPCIGYCMHRPAHLSRRLARSGSRASGTVRPRHFLLIPASEPTEWHRHGTSDMLTVYLRQQLLDAVASDLAGRSVTNAYIDLPLGGSDPFVEQTALALYAALREPEDGTSALYADSLAYGLAAHLLRRWTSGRASSTARAETAGALAAIPAFIEERLADELSVECLAAEAGMSPRMFSRAFAIRYGTTPHKYVLDRRLERAKHLLKCTNAGIVEIALQVGFSSQSHLATAFKRLTGVTPREYRSS